MQYHHYSIIQLQNGVILIPLLFNYSVQKWFNAIPLLFNNLAAK